MLQDNAVTFPVGYSHTSSYGLGGWVKIGGFSIPPMGYKALLTASTYIELDKTSNDFYEHFSVGFRVLFKGSVVYSTPTYRGGRNYIGYKTVIFASTLTAVCFLNSIAGGYLEFQAKGVFCRAHGLGVTVLGVKK